MDLNSTNDNSGSSNEPSVDEGAFWHTNMDLYYGYLPGEVVEVEHEPNKYWLASIQYCFKHLVLLKWVGNYGSEFWVDTSTTNSASSSTTSSSGAPSEPFSNPKRLYSLGHHMQGQFRSQFNLEKPSKILVKPSLYNPSKDPYADIRTVKDLLVHEVDDQNNDDTYATTHRSTSDTASLALAKCKSKINYGQEDEEELEAALQSLNGLADWERTESPQDTQIKQAPPTNQMKANQETSLNTNGTPSKPEQEPLTVGADKASEVTADPDSLASDKEIWSEALFKQKDYNLMPEMVGIDFWRHPAEIFVEEKNDELQYTNTDAIPFIPFLSISSHDIDRNSKKVEEKEKDKEKEEENEEELESDQHDAVCYELCKNILNSASTKGRYLGVDSSGIKHSDVVFQTKPKLLYDIGGANHERLFVRGTLLSICHTIEDDSGQLDVFQWPAFVVKNVGGRLTLRWFLCDEPKFKQGRLEMKSCLSRFVSEEAEQTTSEHGDSNKITESLTDSGSAPAAIATPRDHVSAKSLTFSMHFCNPRIQSTIVPATSDSDIEFKLPNEISSHLPEIIGHQEAVANLERSQLEHVFDARRINLDRDRPLINHILTAIRHRAPLYLDLIFSPKDTSTRREVLISCPRITKLLRATIKRELRPGVFEIHSDPPNGSDEIIKFVYPYDGSYTILPLEWSTNNQDCLSIHPSRCSSPMLAPQIDVNDENTDNIKKEQPESSESNQQADEAATQSKTGMNDHKIAIQTTPDKTNCLMPYRLRAPRAGGSYKIHDDLTCSVPETGEEVDKSDPAFWSQELRKRELEAPSFHCCIDDKLREAVESRFKVMDHLEIYHPTSNSIICSGRIRKVVFPMLWIQLSPDYYTLVPFDLTDIYPVGWCEANEHKLVSLLPPRRRCAADLNEGTTRSRQSEKRSRKKVKISHNKENNAGRALDPASADDPLEAENFDLVKLNDRQADISYILNEKSSYIKIFFNHKCFTGPSLSKSKICTLPQYVGPGAMRLVIEEVVTKLISVAYVPPRILNDLSSKSFEELLIERNLTNTVPVEFKAKYQKRVHRDKIPVCVNPDDVALYCECMCEHIKCCYNLFGMNLYDGDFCPSNCRSLTKSNKFMKRATYYREKARQGEVVSQQSGNSSTNNVNSSNCATQNGSNQTNNNRDSNKNSNMGAMAPAVAEANTNTNANIDIRDTIAVAPSTENLAPETISKNTTNRAIYNGRGSSDSNNSTNISRSDEDMDSNVRSMLKKPEEWTIEEVAELLKQYQLEIFTTYMQSECIDGQALLLLDRPTIEEHFQLEAKSEITQEDVNKLCDTVDWFRNLSKIC